MNTHTQTHTHTPVSTLSWQTTNVAMLTMMDGAPSQSVKTTFVWTGQTLTSGLSAGPGLWWVSSQVVFSNIAWWILSSHGLCEVCKFGKWLSHKWNMEAWCKDQTPGYYKRIQLWPCQGHFEVLWYGNIQNFYDECHYAENKMVTKTWTKHTLFLWGLFRPR